MDVVEDGIFGAKTWGALGVTYTGPGATPAEIDRVREAIVGSLPR